MSDEGRGDDNLPVTKSIYPERWPPATASHRTRADGWDGVERRREDPAHKAACQAEIYGREAAEHAAMRAEMLATIKATKQAISIALGVDLDDPTSIRAYAATVQREREQQERWGKSLQRIGGAALVVIAAGVTAAGAAAFKAWAYFSVR